MQCLKLRLRKGFIYTLHGFYKYETREGTHYRNVYHQNSPRKINLQNLTRNEPDQEQFGVAYKTYVSQIVTPYCEVYRQIYVENFLFACASTTFTT
jgi:hypothetical protein